MAQQVFRSDDTQAWFERFSNGSDGSQTVSANQTDSTANTTASGTLGSKTLTVGSASGFANGNLVLIHQSRNGGDGAGSNQLNVISSGGNTTTWTMEYPLTHNFDTTAQVYLLKQYSSYTLNSGVTITGQDWNGTKGGIFAVLCSGPINIAGTINLHGATGQGNADPASQTTGGGYRGGKTTDASIGNQGEGTSGAGIASVSANGNGGGGGRSGSAPANAAGGGNGTAGGNDSGGNAIGGTTAGSNDLLTMVFGGAGGGGGWDGGTNHSAGAGGSGGGIVILIGKTITVSGAINVNGGAGGPSSNPQDAGGGGAGGSVLLKSQTAPTLGSNLITATGGSGGSSGGGTAGAGGNGRIEVEYATGTISGTTNPSYNSRTDSYFADQFFGGVV